MGRWTPSVANEWLMSSRRDTTSIRTKSRRQVTVLDVWGTPSHKPDADSVDTLQRFAARNSVLVSGPSSTGYSSKLFPVICGSVSWTSDFSRLSRVPRMCTSPAIANAITSASFDFRLYGFNDCRAARKLSADTRKALPRACHASSFLLKFVVLAVSFPSFPSVV